MASEFEQHDERNTMAVFAAVMIACNLGGYFYDFMLLGMLTSILFGVVVIWWAFSKSPFRK